MAESRHCGPPRRVDLPEPRFFPHLTKKKSVFLAENTDPELVEFLKSHHTIYIPVGATEQHGPHSPIGTDVILPQEIARRVCEKQGDALVAPPLPYSLSYPHRGFTSEFSLGIETFMAVVRDVSVINLMHDIERTFRELPLR